MKTFKNVLIAILDGVQDDTGDFMDATTQISWVTPHVKILPSAGQRNAWPIGKAENIRMDQSKLYADLEFYDEPDAETLKKIPSFFGTLISRVATHITAARLDAVGMAKENYDKRIPALETYQELAACQRYYEKGYAQPSKMEEKVCTCERLIFGHSEGCPWTK